MRRDATRALRFPHGCGGYATQLGGDVARDTARRAPMPARPLQYRFPKHPNLSTLSPCFGQTGLERGVRARGRYRAQIAGRPFAVDLGLKRGPPCNPH